MPRIDVIVGFGYGPPMILPGSWAAVLEPLRPAFRRRGTFALFCVLATGMVAQTSRRSVVGMLSGARMAATVSFHAACRFFSHAVWDVERLGLLAERLRRVSRFLRQEFQGFIECAVWFSWVGVGGLLIQAAVGRAGGCGGLRTNRSGLRAYAALRTTARTARTVSACP